jgi:hypothetical protein
MKIPTAANHRVVRVAAAANADVRTVRKVIRGEPTRAGVRERIEAALRAEGLGHLVRAS